MEIRYERKIWKIDMFLYFEFSVHYQSFMFDLILLYFLYYNRVIINLLWVTPLLLNNGLSGNYSNESFQLMNELFYE